MNCLVNWHQIKFDFAVSKLQTKTAHSVLHILQVKVI